MVLAVHFTVLLEFKHAYTFQYYQVSGSPILMRSYDLYFLHKDFAGKRSLRHKKRALVEEQKVYYYKGVKDFALDSVMYDLLELINFSDDLRLLKMYSDGVAQTELIRFNDFRQLFIDAIKHWERTAELYDFVKNAYRIKKTLDLKKY